MPWVAPQDIATAIGEEMEVAAVGQKVRYVASEELTCNQIARTIGQAIGKPYLKWGTITDKQMMDGLMQFNIPEAIAADITEMNAAQHSGVLYEDYYRNAPAKLGRVKISDFAKEFAARYKQP